MEEQITLDPAITSGEDLGKGRRGVDWDYVKQAVAQHHQTERDANRRRGQSTFNRLIGQGVSYADALRQAGDDGLFFDDNEGQQRAFQRMEALKSKSTPNHRAIVVPGKGLFEANPDTGKYELTQPIEPKPAPIVATQKDPITGASLRLNADQLRGQQIKSTLKEKSELEPQSHVFGAPTYDPVALQKNTDQLKALRISSPSAQSTPEIPIVPQSQVSPGIEKVKVRKGGKSFMLPKSQLDEALKQGYEVGQ